MLITSVWGSAPLGFNHQIKGFRASRKLGLLLAFIALSYSAHAQLGLFNKPKGNEVGYTQLHLAEDAKTSLVLPEAIRFNATFHSEWQDLLTRSLPYYVRFERQSQLDSTLASGSSYTLPAGRHLLIMVVPRPQSGNAIYLDALTETEDGTYEVYYHSGAPLTAHQAQHAPSNTLALLIPSSRKLLQFRRTPVETKKRRDGEVEHKLKYNDAQGVVYTEYLPNINTVER